MPKRSAVVGLVLLAVVALALSWLALSRPAATHTTGTPSRPTGEVPVTPTPTDGSSPSASASPTQSQAQGTLVVLGDGYSAAASWPRYAGEALGMTVVNMAASGTGYTKAPGSCPVAPCTSFKDSAAKVAAAKPAVVVVVGGEVDGDVPLAADATATLTTLKQAVPQARIVFMTPISSRATHPVWLTTHAETLKTVAADGNAIWIDTSSVVATASSYANGDLTDESSQRIAAQLVEGLK
ncbi:hypothetical protein ACQB6R_09835 [Propionibacteriaceae bacterium G1746]